GGDAAAELPVSPLPEFPPDASAAVAQLGELAGTHAVLACCSSAGELSRLQELLTEFAPGAGQVVPLHAYCHRGFVWNDPGSGPAGGRRPVAVVPYHELLHRFQTRRRFRAGSTRLRAGRAVDTFLDIKPGDIVVHRDHGLAKFVGLTLLEPASARVSAAARLRRPGPRKAAADADLEEYLTLEFAHGAKLHVPATTIDQVQRYVGAARGGAPSLSVLGGERWKRQKQEAAESVRGLASELLRVRAAREHLPGTRFPADTPWQREFEAEFPFEETEDQLAALQEIKRDMQTARPMDRLLCGDVGYGKTELALRAAFKAAEFGRQVAVLVPTTVLAEQHERTMRARLAGYPFRIESLSRLKSAKQVNETLAAVRKGHVDVVVGTHRLLSKDVRFADLGLLVVDEEQRFGVEHKERLLALRLTVDVLTMSATPIPRTLHMAMLGLRDISTLSTPPLDRRAVVTEVVPYSERRIQQAIARELAREGQVYFVHNRVHNIRQVAERVRALAPPAARVVIGHGQMEPKELEGVMLAFMRREADILVCTTIIESGIDNPTANTIIISDADRFGLSDLHQLRGRVGRYKHRAYCYLLLPESRPVTEKARRRLRAIEEFSMLGAGFKIAMRDLEIRGAGNILGPEQSGHIAAVGYEMYCELLEQAVKHLRNEPVVVPSQTSVELGLVGVIPKAYIPSDARRLDAYRRLTLAQSPEQLDAFERELQEAYGPAPPPVRRLLDLAELRIAANRLEVRALAVRDQDVVFRTPDPGRLESLLREAKGTVRILPPKPGEEVCEVYYRPPESYFKPQTLLAVLRKHLCAPRPAAADGAPAHDGPAPTGAAAEGRHRSSPGR
ncbi:MAG TPA: transcription-repair coupling factor, partial [Phycisphaerales bacterium]|nr:transcription-repair coupling factor [Phycisphaerales bacterium]